MRDHVHINSVLRRPNWSLLNAGECAVCLEALRAGDRRRVLPRCEHGFHAQCVDSWLSKRPICRAEVAAGRGKEADAPVGEEASVETVTET
ncbi:hypothetical protein ABZP36_033254 [Zizania latifolia]